MIVLSRSKNAAAAGELDDGPDTSSELARSTGGGGGRCSAGIRRWTPCNRSAQSWPDVARQGPDRATVGCPARPGEVQLNPPELNRRRPPSIPPDGGRPVRSPWADRPSVRRRTVPFGRIGCLCQRLHVSRMPDTGLHPAAPHRHISAPSRRNPRVVHIRPRHPQRTNSSVRTSRAAPGLTCGPQRAGRRGGAQMRGRRHERAGGETGPDAPGERRRGLVMVSDMDLLDAVLRTAAAAGCEVVRAARPHRGSPELAGRSGRPARPVGRPGVRDSGLPRRRASSWRSRASRHPRRGSTRWRWAPNT